MYKELEEDIGLYNKMFIIFAVLSRFRKRANSVACGFMWVRQARSQRGAGGNAPPPQQSVLPSRKTF